MKRYGCRWADGTETGPITERHALAAHYAREWGGTVIEYV